MIGDADMAADPGVETLDDLAGAMDASEVAEEELPEVEDEAGEAEAPDSEDGPEEEDSDDEDDSEDEDEPVFTIKIDGKETTVKQSELIELGQKGLDYTQKTMAVAEERKAVEAEKATVAELRQQSERALRETVERLHAYRAYMEGQVGSPPPISLAQQDAARYLAEKELYEARKGQLHQANAEIQRLQEDQHRQRQAALLREAESAERSLKDTLPGWNDKTLSELTDYIAQTGIKPELNEVFVTKGFWEMAHKAKAFDALQAEKAKLKPVSKLSKVQKPSSANQPVKRSDLRRKEAEQKYARNPSLETLAGLIE